MTPVACQWGLCSCFEQYSVVLTDEDGSDSTQEFINEVESMVANPELHYIPVPFYISTGSIGMLHTETMLVFVYAGIPFILVPPTSINGAGLSDAMYGSDGGRLISNIYGKNNRRVFSLGYIDETTKPLDYAVDYLKHNPPIASIDIDETVAERHIVHEKVNERIGVISRDGGTRLEIYTMDSVESRMIRNNKDFMGGQPYDETGIPVGKTEVIAYGGMPEIIQIGCLCSMDGHNFDVWVPNVPRMTMLARDIFNDGILPIDVFTIDTSAMEECYAVYHSRLAELENEAIDREIQEETDTETPPEIPVDEA